MAGVGSRYISSPTFRTTPWEERLSVASEKHLEQIPGSEGMHDVILDKYDIHTEVREKHMWWGGWQSIVQRHNPDNTYVIHLLELRWFDSWHQRGIHVKTQHTEPEVGRKSKK